MKSLVVILVTLVLASCGGAGGGAGSGVFSSGTPAGLNWPPTDEIPPGSTVLDQYAGVWRQACNNHMRSTMTATAQGNATLTLVTVEEYFDNADCTVPVVATGIYGLPNETNETVHYTSTLANATVRLEDGQTLVADVDPGSSQVATLDFNFSGSGVLSSTTAFGLTTAQIHYTSGDVTVQRTALTGGTTHGALLLVGNDLLTLSYTGNSATSFQVNRRYFR